MHALALLAWAILAPLYIRREWRAAKDSAPMPNPRTGEPCTDRKDGSDV